MLFICLLHCVYLNKINNIVLRWITNWMLYNMKYCQYFLGRFKHHFHEMCWKCSYLSSITAWHFVFFCRFRVTCLNMSCIIGQGLPFLSFVLTRSAPTNNKLNGVIINEQQVLTIDVFSSQTVNSARKFIFCGYYFSVMVFEGRRKRFLHEWLDIYS